MWSACETTKPHKRPPPGAEGAPAGTFYAVKPGDTLWGLSQRAGVPVDELMELNGLDKNSTLQVGQLLFIPDVDAARMRGPNRVAPRPTAPRAKPRPRTKLAIPVAPDVRWGWPTQRGVVFRTFTTRTGRRYEGIAIGAPPRTPVHAAAKGEVLHVGTDANLGTLVLVRHAHDYVTVYGHLGRVDVHRGQSIDRGDALGTVGETGNAESPMVYFQVRKARTPINPLTILPEPS